MSSEAVQEARSYIAMFRKHMLRPGAAWVDTPTRRILLDNMTDGEALFVAGEFRRMETAAAMRSAKRGVRPS